MNRNLYKIIFNPHRNSLMAVPETASAAGRSAGRRTSRRSPRMPNLRLCTAAFFTSAALGPAGFAAAADICTDRSAAAHEQATVLLSANGLPQANIQTPNGADLCQPKRPLYRRRASSLPQPPDRQPRRHAGIGQQP